MNDIRMRLTGSGGQGLILAGIIIAEAAIMEGKNAIQSQSYGPEARGGASKAEVIISDSMIEFPKVEVPNVLLCLTQKALNKYVGDMDGEGYLIIDESLNISDDDVNCKVIRAPILRTATEDLKKPIVANIVAIGLLCEITGMVKIETAKECILDRVPAGTEDLNVAALEAGVKLAKNANVSGGITITNDITLEERIRSFYPKFSKNQKLIADYILKDSIEILFLKAYTLGKSVGVSASTVGRFAQFIGYEDYNDMQKSLANTFKNTLSTLERFNMLKESTDTERDIKSILIKDVDNIKHTLEMNDFEGVSRIGKEIHEAKNIYIVGHRSSKIPAEYLAFYLNLMKENIKLVPAGAGELLDEIVHIDSKDVLIVFSFPRYSKKTLAATQYAKYRNAKVFAITDSNKSPIVDFADEVMFAESGMSTFIDSMTAPISMVNALIIALAKENEELVEKKFTRLENLWNKYDVYEK